jgi:hypothetical protein
MTAHLHIDRWWSESTLRSFEVSTIFLALHTAGLSPVSATKQCSEKTTIRESRGSHYKSDEALSEVSKNGFQEWF